MRERETALSIQNADRDRLGMHRWNGLSRPRRRSNTRISPTQTIGVDTRIMHCAFLPYRRNREHPEFSISRPSACWISRAPSAAFSAPGSACPVPFPAWRAGSLSASQLLMNQRVRPPQLVLVLTEPQHIPALDGHPSRLRQVGRSDDALCLQQLMKTAHGRRESRGRRFPCHQGRSLRTFCRRCRDPQPNKQDVAQFTVSVTCGNPMQMARMRSLSMAKSVRPRGLGKKSVLCT